MRAKGLDPTPGAFGENLVVRGLDLDALGIGSRLEIGPVRLEITQIGRVCHTRRAIHHSAGDCIMPRMGVFARVVSGGAIAPGAKIKTVLQVPRDTIQAAVLTVSDRCAAGKMEDTAGPATAVALADGLQAHLAWTGIVPDEADAIESMLKDVADRGVDLLATVGGTGCGPRDVTPEATRKVITRDVPGLAEAMRTASAREFPHALLQRGICGIRGRTLIVNLPGSLGASVENLSVILPVLPHAIQLLRGQTDRHPAAR